MDWIAVEAIGTWAGALGTIAAVITALYLGLYQNRQKLRIVAGDGYYLESFSDFTITITNIGFKTVVVQELKWIMTNYPNENRLVLSEFLKDKIGPPPYRLIEGESLKIVLNKENLQNIIRGFCIVHDLDIEPIFFKDLKLSVVTIKESIEVAVEKELVGALMKMVEKDWLTVQP